MRISEVTQAALVLLGLDSQPARSLSKSWHSILSSRLALFYALPASTPSSVPPGQQSEDDLRLITAREACALLLLYSRAALADEPSTSAAASMFGSRDIKCISMLSGLVGHWGILPGLPSGLVPPSYLAASSTSSVPRSATGKIHQLPSDADEKELHNLVRNVLDIVLLPQGTARGSGKGQLATLVLPQLLLPLVAALVWAVTEKSGDWAEQGLERLLAMNTPTTTLSTLISLLSSTAVNHPHLKAVVADYLSKQLLRPTGVRSLLIVVVASDDDVPMTKLDMLKRLLGSPAEGRDRKDYFKIVVPQLIAVLQTSFASSLPNTTSPAPPAPPIPILRATSYVLSSLLLSYPDFVLPYFHSSLTPAPPPPSAGDEDGLDPVILPSPLAPILLLSTLILQSPPFPHLLLTLLGPLLPLLLTLSNYFHDDSSSSTTVFIKDSPATLLLKDEVEALLSIYGKSVDVPTLLLAIPKVIEEIETSPPRERGYWARTIDGDVVLRSSRAEERDARELPLKPETIVAWLKEIGRKELSAKVFLRWLSEVRILENEGTEEGEGLELAKKSLLRLQLVLKMVEELGAGEILTEPKEIVEFVAHVLEPRTTEQVDTEKKKEGLEGLRIVEESEEDGEIDAEEGDQTGLGKDEMVLTGLTLLLAVLEGNEGLNMETTPLLQVIYSHLDTLASTSPSLLIPPLAREARLVLSARKASGQYGAGGLNKEETENPSRVLYLSALKLLQDPLLPVRAQGLAQLRALLDSSVHPNTDPALLPAILDIFIQALEDDDSFLYLSAVQGLSGLVDRYGRQMVKRLVEVYGARGKEVGKGEKGRRELDKRLRMGEALVQVVQRAGTALAVFVDDIIPTLLLILRTSTLPTPLRSSSLTVLATSIDTAPMALLPYAPDLADACLTLLSLESRPLSKVTSSAPPLAPPKPVFRSHSSDSDSSSDLDDEERPTPAMDRNGKLKRPEETPNPISTDPKQPALRRSALLFLALLFRSEGKLVPAPVKNRARTVLEYVRMTDEDGLVRHQAGEVLESI